MKFDVYSAIKGNSVSMHLQKLKINPWIVFINLSCQENLENVFSCIQNFEEKIKFSNLNYCVNLVQR